MRVSSRPFRTSVVDTALIVAGRIRPYRFDASKYPDSFVSQTTVEPRTELPVPRALTMFWLGTAPLTPNRKRAVESIHTLNPDLDVRLLGLADFDDFLIENEPLHPAFRHLALTHQADYLRCYLMHFHGGGYNDVKPIFRSWQPAIERLASTPDKWALGYRELHYSSTTILPGAVQDDVRRNFFLLIGNSGFIMRPRTPLTAEWYAEIRRRMDVFAPSLAIAPGGIRGGEEEGDYPIPKHALLGDILAPLALKYHDRLIIDDSIRPDFANYL